MINHFVFKMIENYKFSGKLHVGAISAQAVTSATIGVFIN